MSYENKKKAQARMTAYWEKRRAQEAEAARVTAEPVQVEASLPVAVLEKPVEIVVPRVSEHEIPKDVPKDTEHDVPKVSEVAPAPVPPARTSSRQYQIIANSDGMMVCENGPCLCGKGKREWHSICCKP